MEWIIFSNWYTASFRASACDFNCIFRSTINIIESPLAAGWFAGFVQAYFKRPNVKDFETLAEDVFSVKGFWHNKVTRVLLVVVLANIGSSIGTLIGGADVIRLFFQNL